MTYQILTGICLICLALMSYYLFRRIEHQDTIFVITISHIIKSLPKKSQEQLGLEGVVSAVIKGEKNASKKDNQK